MPPFEAERKSFTEFLLERRLERAHPMLGDPRLIDRPVGVIAFASEVPERA